MTDVNEQATSDEPETPEDPAPTEQSKEPVKLRISVYFDGTGNNRANTKAREGNTAEYQLVRKQAPLESKDGSQVIGTSVASFESDYTNVALMEENFKDNSQSALEFHTAIYVEGAGTRDLNAAAQRYQREMEEYKALMDLNVFYRTMIYGLVPPPRPKFSVDSNLGFSTATFATGIYAKINTGFTKVIDWYGDLVEDKKIKPKKHEITEILVDVFGFSRGAATARTFIHHILQGERVKIGTKSTARGTRAVYSKMPVAKLQRGMRGYRINIKENAVKVDFAGLFDTVSSYQNALTSDVKSLKLDAVAKARKTYHLAAAEEHRQFFSLTDISSAKNAGTGEEYFLPGVHSDIGGSYREAGAAGQEEDFDIMDADSWMMFGLNTSSITVHLSDYADMLKREGWFNNDTTPGRPEIQVNKKNVYVGGYMGIGGSTYEVEHSISIYRDQVNNTYRRIPLNLMVEEAVKNGLTFEPELTDAYEVPAELAPVDSAIRSYIGRIGNNSHADDWFKKSSADIGNEFNIEYLRNKHLHYSAKISLGLWPRFSKGERSRYRYTG